MFGHFSRHFKYLLPPASEGWGKVLFSQASVCSHLGGGGEYPSQVQMGGGYPARSGMPHPGQGGYPLAKVGTPSQARYPPAKVDTPAKVGTPQPRWVPSPAKVGTPPQGLATRRVVCLLRSRRRTFFCDLFLRYWRTVFLKRFHDSQSTNCTRRRHVLVHSTFVHTTCMAAI